MGIYLSPEERDALMSRFDTNRDGNISDVEIYNVLILTMMVWSPSMNSVTELKVSIST